jgi:REP element-mobilizing transposase RayT
MVRQRKRHVQLALPMPRKRDKNGGLRGGARLGAGRPKKPISEGRASEPHKVRPRIRANRPVHVVMRAAPVVGTLRTHAVFRAVREATLVAADKHAETFRIVHLSIQRSHIHLIVEAKDRTALARGMQAFGISAAKHINALIGARTGDRRRGTVFADRYHAVILMTPRQVRNTIMYVLNNWHHHGESTATLRKPWKLDPYSSAITFDGWKEREHTLFRIPDGYDGMFTWLPRTWLLKIGWRRWGLISVAEVPGAGAE